MGKKRIITKSGSEPSQRAGGSVAASKSAKKQILKGVITIASSYNNTIVSMADNNGDVVVWSSAGLMGFKGARKSTPYAATIVAKDVVEKAKRFGLQEVRISVKGIGPGREAAIRGIASTGVSIASIMDNTPIPHNGIRPPKPRRV